MPSHRTRGFTLIEVLIALAVLAVGLIAVLGTAGTSTRLGGQLRDDTLANWVGMNELATLRLAPALPELGSSEGDADMGGDPSNPEKWHWKATVSGTPDPDLLRVDIDVSNGLAPKDVVTSVTGFIGKPGPPAGAPAGIGGGAAPQAVCK